MADVGGQRQHGLIDIHALGLPLGDASNHEVVPQVMDAGGMVGSAVVPAQFFAQFAKDAMHLAIPQRQASASTACTDEERAF